MGQGVLVASVGSTNSLASVDPIYIVSFFLDKIFSFFDKNILFFVADKILITSSL